MVTHTICCHAFAELLAERCEIADLDKKVWADAIGVSEKNWSKYTRGATLPNDSTFAKVATSLFKIAPEDLVEMLCERMARVSRQGIIRDAAGRFVPTEPEEQSDDDTPYSVDIKPLELSEPTPARRARNDIMELSGLSPESIDYLQATWAWLSALDAKKR